MNFNDLDECGVDEEDLSKLEISSNKDVRVDLKPSDVSSDLGNANDQTFEIQDIERIFALSQLQILKALTLFSPDSISGSYSVVITDSETEW